MSAAAKRAEDARVAEDYYDSADADRFYFEIWGGEDIHIGLYDSVGVPSIRQASQRTVALMASKLPRLGPDSRVLDAGAGYGGAARWLARETGAQVVCVNISETQNALNRQKTAEQGLGGRIEVLHGSFDDLPAEDASMDAVWSQDAFLHGADRAKIVREAARVLKPGGRLIFTDPMQADDAPQDGLAPILARIHLSSMGSVAFYRQAAREAGLEEIEIDPMPEMLGLHYASVRESLEARREELTARGVSPDYIDRMLAGLGHWIEGAARGRLNWGVLHFGKPG